jgi:hypothetical protein
MKGGAPLAIGDTGQAAPKNKKSESKPPSKHPKSNKAPL